MVARALVTMALVAMLAGCATPAEKTDADSVLSETPLTMKIRGSVLDETLAPIAGANLSIRMTKQVATTNALGGFEFANLPRSTYVLDAQATGYQNSTLVAEARELSQLTFVLFLIPDLQPRNVTTEFHGILQCALEALIISPSCDSAFAEGPIGDSPANPPHVFSAITTFNQLVEQRWKTVIVDVVFDPTANPGLAGLRLAARGQSDPQALGSYDKFGTFYGPDDFTARMDVDQSYPESTRSVAANTTAFELQIFPHSHAWHAGGVSPFLGVGVGLNVVFDVYVTVFYNEPAPKDWSFRTSAPA